MSIPMLGDFAYGQVLFQTQDAQDFCVADLLDNVVYDLIITKLKQIDSPTEALSVLATLADDLNGKRLVTDQLCPNCKAKQWHFNDNVAAETRTLTSATWQHFMSLSADEQLKRITQMVM